MNIKIEILAYVKSITAVGLMVVLQFVHASIILVRVLEMHTRWNYYTLKNKMILTCFCLK